VQAPPIATDLAPRKSSLNAAIDDCEKPKKRHEMQSKRPRELRARRKNLVKQRRGDAAAQKDTDIWHRVSSIQYRVSSIQRSPRYD
jgi:hypothetical protein